MHEVAVVIDTGVVPQAAALAEVLVLVRTTK